MKFSRLFKKYWQAITAVMVIAAMVAGLITAIVLLSRPSNVQTKGIIDGEMLDSGEFSYSTDTNAYFKKAFKTYYDRTFSKLLKQLYVKQSASQILKPDELSSALLTAMRNGKVTADKVLSFGKYLQEVDSEDVPLYIIAAYLVPETDENGEYVYTSDGVQIYTFGETADLSILEQGGIDPKMVLDDILENTTITTEDMSNICYHILLNSAEGEYKEVLTKLNEEGFRALFVDGSTALDMIYSLEEGVSVSDIRTSLELLYEVGVEYQNVLSNIGASGVKVLTRGISGSALVDDFGFGSALRTAMDGLGEASPTLVAFIGNVLTAIPTGIAVPLEKAINSGSAWAKAYASVSLAKISLAALDDALEYAESDEEEIVNSLAKLLGGVEYISTLSGDAVPEQADMDAHIASYKQTLENSLAKIKEIATHSNVVNGEYKDVAIDSAEATAVCNLVDELNVESEGVLDGLNRISSIVMYNLMLSVFEK